MSEKQPRLLQILSSRIPDHYRASKITDKQMKILTLLATGKSVVEIANALLSQPKIINEQILQAQKSIEATNKANLILWLYMKGAWEFSPLDYDTIKIIANFGKNTHKVLQGFTYENGRFSDNKILTRRTGVGEKQRLEILKNAKNQLGMDTAETFCLALLYLRAQKDDRYKPMTVQTK